MKAYMVEFTRSLTRRVGVLGESPEEALEAAQALLASGIDSTADLYDEDTYVNAEHVKLVERRVEAVMKHTAGVMEAVECNPHTHLVVMDDGSTECVMPEPPSPYVFEWRGDSWVTNGEVMVVASGGPNIEGSQREWRQLGSIQPDALAQVEAWILAATHTLNGWHMASTRWAPSPGVRQKYAMAKHPASDDGAVPVLEREVVCDERFVRGMLTAALRWTCSMEKGTPVCGWNGDRLVIVVMPMRADRIVHVGAT